MNLFNIVTSDVLQRVFLLKVGNNLGTGFIVETSGEKYLVTARHLFSEEGYPSSFKFGIKRYNKWEDASGLVYYHSDPTVDLTVIKTEYFNDWNFDAVGYEGKEVILGQEVHMLGFPYGLENEAYSLNRGCPLPLVKKGIVSGYTSNNRAFWLDWDNNQGFSGGPVVYRKLTQYGYSTEHYIAGVIVAYIPHPIEVLNEKGKGMRLYVQENSGIGQAYKIEEVLQIISSIRV